MLSSIGLLGSVVVLSTSSAGVAVAAPGDPDVPNAPVTVYTEDFENGVAADPVSLTAYTGADGTTYTAAAPWLTACNGSILEFNAPDSAIGLTSCPPVNGSFDRVRQLAHALGQHDEAADPATNHAVTAYTEGSSPGAGLVQFETVDPIPLLASNRFVTFSVDAAAQNCFAAHPLFGFYLLDGDQVIPTFVDGDPIDPCDVNAGGEPYTAPAVGGSGPDAGILAGTYTANSAYLFSGSELGIRMVNFQGSGGGNDAAFDNIRILDATPQLYKSYSAPSQTEGLPLTLTFTITNTSELGEKAGWSFTDTLPAGMTVAAPASLSTTCPSGLVNATATTVSVTGNLALDQENCTASVNVTAGAGTYVNGPDNITGIGVDAPPPATVTFDAIDPSLSLVKNSVLDDANTNGVADVGESVQYSFDVTNTGNIAINPVTIDDSKVGAVTCPTGALAAGATITCVAASYVVTQADVDAGVVFNEATATGTPVPPPGYPAIPPVDSAPAEDELPVPAAAPSISVAKSAVLTDTNDNGTAEVGESIQFNFVVTNTGNVTLSNVSVDDPKAGAVTCPVTQLAPGQNTLCSADALYVVTQADVDGGVVTNTATASGLQPVLDPANPPAPVQSDPSISETPAPEAAPSLSLLKLSLLEDLNENGTADLGERVAYGFVVTNTGNVTLTDLAIDDPKAGTVTCVDQPVGPGLSVTCEADEPYIATQADIDAGEVFNSATASGLQPVLDPENPPAPTVSEPSEISIPATFAPAVSVEKNGELIDDNDNGTADVGESIEYSFLVTNTGNVTLTEIAVDDPKAGAVTCPTEPLARAHRHCARRTSCTSSPKPTSTPDGSSTTRPLPRCRRSTIRRTPRRPSPPPRPSTRSPRPWPRPWTWSRKPNWTTRTATASPMQARASPTASSSPTPATSPSPRSPFWIPRLMRSPARPSRWPRASRLCAPLTPCTSSPRPTSMPASC
ncbi:DUF7507 domain-containing protein [Variovorax sp. PBS-H4]|uniref:DUF7507 domain-containing protein n=1 Tax=Variovorax sp. PBS-H4 TaxID=434008 RepID=UPI0013A58DF8|nr:hypothetical protein [Variovorax sp. PBS-H4]